MLTACCVAILLTCPPGADAPAFDERPAEPEEWGARPADVVVTRNPPPFSWRPQDGAVTYRLEIAPTAAFARVAYAADSIPWNVHCPTEVLEPGTWWWRVRFRNADDAASAWSSPRSFRVDGRAVEFPLPDRAEIMRRVPDTHPRLFVRPEQIDELRARFAPGSGDAFAALLARGEALLHDSPETTEPPKYGADMERGSDEWRAVWWDNRRFTIRLLDGAATLGFLYQMTGDARFGTAARRRLLAAAAWDPEGSTGYDYNDEAGMPFAYHFARTYTFIHELLIEAERETCRDVMLVRGREMYEDLCPEHFWRPYSSHDNRAWHFLGEVAIAFHGEIPEADDWLWFAVNVFANVYPVWSDADGGWHEGMNYFSSYMGRFTWWADVMREAVGLDAYALPYFAHAGDYVMTMLPPGARGGGFGDMNARVTSERLRPLMTTLAVQSGNPHWSWYVDAVGGPRWNAAATAAYVDLLRRARTKPAPRPPDDLAPSRHFRGTGQAVLNVTLEDDVRNVRVVFKSSPFGSQSHGYEAQNAFLLMAYGERLLIRSGQRDSYGSDHHRRWMWETKSVNSITVDGEGQTRHSASAVGAITAFRTSPLVDFVEGEAAGAYDGRLDRFTRRIAFVKPGLLIVHDRLEAAEPSSFEWRLHAPVPFAPEAAGVRVVNGRAACRVVFLAPHDLDVSTTDQFDVPPRPRIELTEHHLTARPPAPVRTVDFVTAIEVWPSNETAPPPPTLVRNDDAFVIDLPRAQARVIIDVPPPAMPLPAMVIEFVDTRWTSDGTRDEKQ